MQGEPHSLASLEWLTYIKRQPDLNIQHARNGGECPIPHEDKTFHVDGYDEHTNKVYKSNM